jgi:hypothetical protein
MAFLADDPKNGTTRGGEQAPHRLVNVGSASATKRSGLLASRHGLQ